MLMPSASESILVVKLRLCLDRCANLRRLLRESAQSAGCPYQELHPVGKSLKHEPADRLPKRFPGIARHDLAEKRLQVAK